MNKLPYVWELSKDGVVSHAVGTMHVAPNVFEQDIVDKLAGRQLMLEINPDDMQPHQKELTTILFEKFTPAEKEEFITLCGLSDEELSEVPAGMMPSYLFNPAAPHEFPAVDYVFYTKARNNDARIFSLETAAEKLEYFRKNNPLERLLKAIRQSPDVMHMAPLFLRQGLYAVMQAYEKGNIPLVRAAETDRNTRMVERSLPHLNAPSIVAVGTNHFLIEPSMLTLYQEKGVRVTRVQ